MSISNIDELLSGAKTMQHPETPENQALEVPETIEDYQDEPITKDIHEDIQIEDSNDSNEAEKEIIESKNKEIDEYGNQKEPENEVIRERLARQARKHQAELDALRVQLEQHGASREVQKAAKDFEYDPQSEGDWQQQLAQFVKETVNSMNREQHEAKTRQEEAEVQRDFERKFRDGMTNFSDFTEVLTSLPFDISNPMTLATRGMENPAAFLYAAAKRNPEELERISKIRDPYAQMTEIGKLEERMRRNKPSTTAPRPLGRASEDSTSPSIKKKSEPTGDDLLARADAKRLATVRQRLKGNR